MSYLICSFVGVALLIVVCAVGFTLYKRWYFRSEFFIILSQRSEGVTLQYEKLISTATKFKKSTYADFTPTSKQQMEMQSYCKGALDNNKTLLPHVYFCTSTVLKLAKESDCKIMRDFCGFTPTPGTLDRLMVMLKDASEIEQMSNAFKEEYFAQLTSIEPEIPLLIRLFAKKKIILLLGLKISENLEDDLYPKYTFKDMSDVSQSITIILDPNMIRTLSAFLEPQSQSGGSMNFTRK